MFRALLCPSSGTPPTAFAASDYRMITGLDVRQAVVGLLVNRPELEARPTRQSYGNQKLQRQLEGAPDHVERCIRDKTINFKLIVYLVGCFIEYLKIHGSTNPKNWQ
jgi:hypothetical protein